jgi:hypothetical protein
MPTELAGVQFIIKTKGDTFDLSKLKEKLKDVYDEPKVSVFLISSIFRLKSSLSSKSHINPFGNQIISPANREFLKTREEIMTILSKKIEDENYSRTNFYDLLKKDFELVIPPNIQIVIRSNLKEKRMSDLRYPLFALVSECLARTVLQLKANLQETKY